MTVGRELLVLRQALQRLLLPYGGVAVDVARHLGREHEEAAVDPAPVALRLLLVAADQVVVDVERAEAARRLYGGDGGEPAVLAVEADQLAEVQIRHAVAVGEAELLAADVGQYALQAAAGHRLGAGVDEGHLPRLGARLV